MEYLKAFLLGGTIIASAKLISTYVDPVYAPLVAGMPTGMVASFFLQSDKVKRRFYGGYMIADLVVALAVAGVFAMTKMFPAVHINVITIVGYLFWLILTLVSITYLKKYL